MARELCAGAAKPGELDSSACFPVSHFLCTVFCVLPGQGEWWRFAKEEGGILMLDLMSPKK